MKLLLSLLLLLFFLAPAFSQDSWSALDLTILKLEEALNQIDYLETKLKQSEEEKQNIKNELENFSKDSIKSTMILETELINYENQYKRQSKRYENLKIISNIQTGVIIAEGIAIGILVFFVSQK